MRAALAIWNERISPVFDVSRQILVLDIENGKILARREETLDDDPVRKAGSLARLKVETLLCGAISKPLAGILAAYGIRTISFISGNCDEVILAFLAGDLPNPQMAMPGCHGRMRTCGKMGGIPKEAPGKGVFSNDGE
ncbi:MAG: NifB/NifX family molybdenum-iron cluster-binding protein [bacterium]